MHHNCWKNKEEMSSTTTHAQSSVLLLVEHKGNEFSLGCLMWSKLLVFICGIIHTFVSVVFTGALKSADEENFKKRSHI
jgi:hypothetical protein